MIYCIRVAGLYLQLDYRILTSEMRRCGNRPTNDVYYACKAICKSFFFDTSMTGRTLKLFTAFTPMMRCWPFPLTRARLHDRCRYEYWVPLLLPLNQIVRASYDLARRIFLTPQPTVVAHRTKKGGW